MARRRCRSGRPPSPHRRQPRKRHPVRSRRCAACSTSVRRHGRRCRGRFPSACRWCRTCTAHRADQWRPPVRDRLTPRSPSARPNRDRGQRRGRSGVGRAARSRTPEVGGWRVAVRGRASVCTPPPGSARSRMRLRRPPSGGHRRSGSRVRDWRSHRTPPNEPRRAAHRPASR